MSKRDCFLNWIRICDPDYPEHKPDFLLNEKDIAPQLYYASLLGLRQVVDWLLEKNADANSEGGFGGYPLIAASSEGHSQVAKRLVEKGADVNAKGGEYGSALQAASLHNHGQIVDWLLEQGAYVNDQGGSHGNALQAASKRWLSCL